MPKETCVVELGRYGDIINMLPAARLLGNWKGERVGLCVSKEFAGVLDGVSYVEPVVVSNHVSQPGNASRVVRSGGWKNVLVSQVWRPDMNSPGHLTEAYNKDSWEHLRMLDYFATEPLVFDRRDFNRELDLIMKLLPVGPQTLLTSFSGHSSPFKYAKRAKQLLEHKCVAVKDLSDLQAERIYDLIGLMECSGGAIFSDSAPLHLAAATGLRVAAFISDLPTTWHGTAPRCLCDFSVRYSAASDETMNLMLDNLRSHWGGSGRFFHVFPWHKFSADAHIRHRNARNSWSRFYRSGELQMLPFFDCHMKRDAREVGAADRVPFVRDIFDTSMSGLRPDDVIVFSNSDVCFMPGLMADLRAAVARYGCFYASRVDVKDSSQRPVPPLSLYCGADLFAFKVSWWSGARALWPDLLVGREGWDAVMKLMMHGSGFRPRKTWPRLPHLFHQKHDSLMHGKAIAVEPGQVYNRKMTESWMKMHGFDSLLLCSAETPKPLVAAFD